MRKIDLIVIHCTDSPDARDIGALEIDRWHRERGWGRIGYHYVVRRNGDVEKGRPDESIGAHVFGHNKNSIGVVWVGKDKPTQAQIDTLARLTTRLCEMYKTKNVKGHCELDSRKTCPNINMVEFRELLCF